MTFCAAWYSVSVISPGLTDRQSSAISNSSHSGDATPYREAHVKKSLSLFPNAPVYRDVRVLYSSISAHSSVISSPSRPTKSTSYSKPLTAGDNKLQYVVSVFLAKGSNLFRHLAFPRRA